MNQIDSKITADLSALDPKKFQDPRITAKGEERAFVEQTSLETLWINTGSICNIECVNCYIESSPTNNQLEFIGVADIRSFFDEIEQDRLPVTEIGLTGGEPFINPEALFIIADALTRGFDVLVLTNAMRPMMLPRVQNGLLKIRTKYRGKVTLRISLDHFSAHLHDRERGEGSFEIALKGLRWLAENDFKIDIAGRTIWGEDDTLERQGYQDLFNEIGVAVDAFDPSHLKLFPEMDAKLDVPEITTDCWTTLGKSPVDMMCASSRMIVKRKGASGPVILPCTLLPYDPQFEMGRTLSQAAQADGGAFRNGAVRLNHPHCAEFCVLGGASCSA